MNLFNFIKQKVSILDLVNSYLSLKKIGNYYKARCPFHQEKTASFTVSPQKDIFYCFGCHTGGDVISFIAKIENCSQLQAAKQLIEQYKLTIPDDLASNNNIDISVDEKNKYIRLCTIFANWCHENLVKYKIGQNYLQKRNITNDSIKKFMLGYFPGGSQFIKNLLAYANKENILAQDFIDAKIILPSKLSSDTNTHSSSNLYSPFENRIIFPITDLFGNIIAFGGRIFLDQDERPKYYNSHEHKFFNKSNILFGLDKAKKKIQEKESVFLVEGYVDVIAMNQHGIENTVATLGTSCTNEHLNQISRLSKKLYVCYDGDEAGQKAILKLIELCWQANIELHVIEFEKNEDPASYLQKNNDINLLIQNSKNIFIFFINRLGQDFHSKSLTERFQLSYQIIEIIANVTDPIKQDILLIEASEKFNIPFESLKKAVRKQPIQDRKNIQRPEKIANKPPNQNFFKITLLEKKLFSAILLYKGTIKEEDIKLLKKLFSQQINNLFEKIINKQESTEIVDLIDGFSEEEKNLVSKLIIETDEINIGQSFNEILILFYKKNWKYIIKDIKENIDIAQSKNDNEKVKEYLNNLDLLKKKLLQRTEND